MKKDNYDSKNHRLALYELELRYWRDVDLNRGRSAHKFYETGATLQVGDNEFRGASDIKMFYDWQRRMTQAASRHVVANYIILADKHLSAEAAGILCLYSSQRGKTTIDLVDFHSYYSLDIDLGWRYQLHQMWLAFSHNDRPISFCLNAEHLWEATTADPKNL